MFIYVILSRDIFKKFIFENRKQENKKEGWNWFKNPYEIIV